MLERYEALQAQHRMIKANPGSVSVLTAMAVERELDEIECWMWGVR